jgi:hypothetical protein
MPWSIYTFAVISALVPNEEVLITHNAQYPNGCKTACYLLNGLFWAAVLPSEAQYGVTQLSDFSVEVPAFV